MMAERRKRPPGKIGGLSPGIVRIGNEIVELLRANDTKWRDKDPVKWLTKLELEAHCAGVGEVLGAMGEARGVSDEEIAIRVSAGQWHDLGKLEPECEALVRRNGKLSREEREYLRILHQQYSGEAIERAKSRARSEDHWFLEIVRIIACNHHTWWQVECPWAFVITLDLSNADIFVALREKRDRPGNGLSLEEAIEILPYIVQLQTPDEVHAAFQREISESIGLISQAIREGLIK